MSRISRSRYLCPALLVAVSLHGVLPLRDQWRAGCEALGGGEPQRALALFREFDQWYGAEPAVAEADFRESRIRLWALAALEAGSFDEAASLLERWLEENPEEERFRAFLRFQLAELHRALGRPEIAETHRQHFLDDHPDLPECILIHWSRADEALARKDIKAARDFMEAVIRHPRLPPSGRALAGAAMAAMEVAEGNQLAALQHLEVPAQGRAREVRDFWRALMAPSLVQQLLNEEMPESALSITEWFDNPHNLQGRMQALYQSMPQNSRAGVRQAIWNGRWSAQLKQLEAALDQVSASLTDTDGLYALRLRALLKANAARDAAVLGQALVESPGNVGPALRAEAYKGAIEACLQLKDWKGAEAYAHSFLETYPDDPALPDILFMNARTAAARKDWSAALDQVNLLIEGYTDHPSLRSWKLLKATWLLDAGRPADALTSLEAFQEDVPAAWQPFMEFQAARCREALKQLDTAEGLYRSVAVNGEAAASLRETASTALLKLHMRQLNSEAFLKDLAGYRARWPDGMNRLIVENLAGSFHRQTGNIAQAVTIFTRVASERHPAADFARSQLSSVYRDSNDMTRLRGHALQWISSAMSSGFRLPPDPFHDLQHYKRTTRDAALPEATVHSLLEALEAGKPHLPAEAFLDALRDDWEAHANTLAGGSTKIREWIESRATACHEAANWPAYAVYLLYAARLYEEAGRVDSADARRIQVIQSVDPALLGESALFTTARTAHAYDFPEMQALLEHFLVRFPDSRQRPDALFLLAGIRRTDGDPGRAVSLLAEIRSAWPDAGVYQAACLRLAQWHLEDAVPDAALDVLAGLLESPRLPPGMTAEALLLRARADFQTGRPERGTLDVFRILTLYPDFHDISESAFNLVINHLQSIDDRTRRAELADRLRATAPEDVLAKFQFTEA